MNTLFRSAVAACALALAAGQASAASREEIATDVGKTLGALFQHTPSAKELAAKAEGILVFPNVYKAGVGLGGSYGEGALVKDGNAIEFYNLVAGSAGFQLGAQKQSIAIMFMTPDSLEKFRKSEGFRVGVDGSIAIIDMGAGKSIDTQTLQQPIVGFVFSNQGLMAGVALEGAKFTKIKK